MSCDGRMGGAEGLSAQENVFEADRNVMVSRKKLGRLAMALAVGAWASGCAVSESQHERVRSERGARVMTVRTTAYTHAEPGGARNALGTRLRFGGEVSSAATDWSWMPVGTRFRVRETGKCYVVEDYGSALVGRKTIDLYMPNVPMMRAWGVREVTIEILEWGSVAMSRMLLEPRQGNGHVKRMLVAMDGH